MKCIKREKREKDRIVPSLAIRAWHGWPNGSSSGACATWLAYGCHRGWLGNPMAGTGRAGLWLAPAMARGRAATEVGWEIGLTLARASQVLPPCLSPAHKTRSSDDFSVGPFLKITFKIMGSAYTPRDIFSNIPEPLRVYDSENIFWAPSYPPSKMVHHPYTKERQI